MTWVAHDPHPNAKDSRPFYTYICKDAKGEDYYAAFIVQKNDGFEATVPYAKVSEYKPYHYTHDTLQDAKDWCIAELWKRRLDQ